MSTIKGSSLRIGGLNSGLDTEAIVKAMSASTKLRITTNQRKVLQLEAQRDAYRSIIGKFEAFQNKYLDILNRNTYMKSSDTFSQFKSKINFDGKDTAPPGVTVTTSPNAVPGIYEVIVGNAATQATATGKPMDEGASTLKASDLTNTVKDYAMVISVGGVDKMLTFKGDTNINNLIDKINDELKIAYGVKNDGTGMVTVEEDSNAPGMLKFTSSDKKAISTGTPVLLDDEVKLTGFTSENGSNSVTFVIDGQTRTVNFFTVDNTFFARLDPTADISVKDGKLSFDVTAPGADASEADIEEYNEKVEAFNVLSEMLAAKYTEEVKDAYETWKNDLDYNGNFKSTPFAMADRINAITDAAIKAGAQAAVDALGASATEAEKLAALNSFLTATKTADERAAIIDGREGGTAVADILSNLAPKGSSETDAQYEARKMAAVNAYLNTTTISADAQIALINETALNDIITGLGASATEAQKLTAINNYLNRTVDAATRQSIINEADLDTLIGKMTQLTDESDAAFENRKLSVINTYLNGLTAAERNAHNANITTANASLKAANDLLRKDITDANTALKAVNDDHKKAIDDANKAQRADRDAESDKINAAWLQEIKNNMSADQVQLFEDEVKRINEGYAEQDYKNALNALYDMFDSWQRAEMAKQGIPTRIDNPNNPGQQIWNPVYKLREEWLAEVMGGMTYEVTAAARASVIDSAVGGTGAAAALAAVTPQGADESDATYEHRRLTAVNDYIDSLSAADKDLANKAVQDANNAHYANALAALPGVVAAMDFSNTVLAGGVAAGKITQAQLDNAIKRADTAVDNNAKGAIDELSFLRGAYNEESVFNNKYASQAVNAYEDFLKDAILPSNYNAVDLAKEFNEFTIKNVFENISFSDGTTIKGTLNADGSVTLEASVTKADDRAAALDSAGLGGTLVADLAAMTKGARETDFEFELRKLAEITKHYNTLSAADRIAADAAMDAAPKTVVGIGAYNNNKDRDFGPGVPVNETTVNTVSTSTTLGALGLTDDDGKYKITINGAEFTFDKNTTINQMMSQINANIKANVNISFSTVTNSFEIKSRDYGKEAKIEIGADPSGLLSKLGLGEFVGKTTQNGTNMTLTVDGKEVETTSNYYTFNGVTVTLGPSANTGDKFTIEVGRDTEAAKKLITDFVKDYNELIDFVFGYINDKPDKKDKEYYFLTDADREELNLSESQEKKWEEKAMKGILYNDRTLTKIMSDLRTTMYSGVPTGNGEIFGLFSMGITTTSNWKNNGKLTIDEKQLEYALANNLDMVTELFTNVKDGIMSKMETAIKGAISTSGNRWEQGTLVQKAGILNSRTVNDNAIADQLKRINEVIARYELRYEKQQDRYWKTFSALEKQMGALNGQGDYLSQMLSSWNQSK